MKYLFAVNFFYPCHAGLLDMSYNLASLTAFVNTLPDLEP